MKKTKLPLPKNKYARIFVKSMLISLAVISSLLIVLAIVFRTAFDRIRVPKTDPVAVHNRSNNTEDNDIIPDPDGDICKNILVFGVDKGESRTDTILLVHFNSETSQVAVISIPRDTKVTWSEQQLALADELGRPSQAQSKITDMSSLGGIDNLRYFTIATIEDMLNITVDNYVIVNTKMLRDVVDQLGGIEFNVPRVMQYRDDWQDLTIDLQPGLQTLNGEQAEGVLRWRHNNDYSEQYGLGDLGRIETQQAFIKTFSEKLLSIHSLTKLTGLIKCAYDNVTTDLDFNEALSYLPYVNTVSANSIIFKTLPGEPVREDRAYFIVDDEEAKTYVSLVFTE